MASLAALAAAMAASSDGHAPAATMQMQSVFLDAQGEKSAAVRTAGHIGMAEMCRCGTMLPPELVMASRNVAAALLGEPHRNTVDLRVDGCGGCSDVVDVVVGCSGCSGSGDVHFGIGGAVGDSGRMLDEPPFSPQPSSQYLHHILFVSCNPPLPLRG